VTSEEEFAKLREEQDRATRAQNVLEEPFFKDAMQALRNEAIGAFKRAPIDDPAALQIARMRYELTEEFLNKLVHHVQTGRMGEGRFAELRKAMGIS
jgi:hypothetical protein